MSPPASVRWWSLTREVLLIWCHAFVPRYSLSFILFYFVLVYFICSVWFPRKLNRTAANGFTSSGFGCNRCCQCSQREAVELNFDGFELLCDYFFSATKQEESKFAVISKVFVKVKIEIVAIVFFVSILIVVSLSFSAFERFWRCRVRFGEDSD